MRRLKTWLPWPAKARKDYTPLTLIYLSSAWVAGIGLGFVLDLPLALVVSGLAPLPLLFFRRYRKAVILASLCLFIFFGGAVQSRSGLQDSNDLSFYNETGTIAVTGMVSEDPDVRDKTTRLRLSAREIKIGEEWQEVTGTTLLFTARYPAYSYGDVLLVNGKLQAPPVFVNQQSGEVEFDYAAFLAHEGIYSTMLYPDIKILETGQGSGLLEWVYSLRNRLSHSLAEVLPEPQASLAQGIILGIRGNIPSSVSDSFAITGTAHILAISGLHLSIVAGMLLSLGIWLFGRRRYFYIWLALGAIWLYALITGMHPPVMRAAIMASIFLTAELLGRQRSAITALAFAAAIMVGLEPQILGTVSFQMSFLAMMGLIFIFPRLRDLGRKLVAATLGKYPAAVPVANLVSDGFSVTLGAIIAVWPLIAYHFGIVSLVGPLATLLALPALPGIIVAGALAAGLGLIALPLAQVLGWLAWPFVSYLLLLVNSFAALPVSAVEAVPTNPALIWAYYPTLALVLWFISHRQQTGSLAAKSLAAAKPAVDKMGGLFARLPRKWLIPPLLVIAVLASAAVLAAPDDKLHISFLDVGQGDAILIQKGSRQILIDGGPSPQAITLELSRQMPFWDRTIDLLVLTHPHADHITGLVEVLGEYRVEQVLYAGLDYDSPIYSQWLKLLDEQGIRGTTARSGQRMELGGVVIEILNPQHPLLAGTDSDIDNNGVVLRVSLGEISFLLTPDIMWPAEFELISRRQVSEITVLKVAHHGSETSTTAGFLAVTSPRLAVISVGADNSFGHPDPDIIARLEAQLGPENIYRTDLQGTIEFITDGQRLWVKVE